MKKSKKSVLGPAPRKRNTVESASLASFGMQESGKGQSAPQNGRKAYQFKPGNKYRWRPGQSGNPNGRPCGDVKAITREFGEYYNPKMGKTRDEHIFEFLYRLGCQGNLKAAELWLNYRWGRPTTPLEHTGSVDLARVIEEARRRDPDLPAVPARIDTPHVTQQPLVAADAAEQDSAHADEQPAKPKVKVDLWTH